MRYKGSLSCPIGGAAPPAPISALRPGSEGRGWPSSRPRGRPLSRLIRQLGQGERQPPVKATAPPGPYKKPLSPGAGALLAAPQPW